MKYADIKSKNKAELLELLKEERLKLGRLKFSLQSKTLKNVSDIAKTKKGIAQILTALQAIRAIKP